MEEMVMEGDAARMRACARQRVALPVASDRAARAPRRARLLLRHYRYGIPHKK